MRCSRRCANSSDAETQLIAFDQVGVALRADGDFKGALRGQRRSWSRSIRARPCIGCATPSALLEAGLGTRAQREALAATKLEPKSALAWKTLGWMLQHDAVGRRFGEGFDRAGAIAAYRKARVLDPTNADISADLAVLLEHDANGVRYSPEPNLDEAISDYQARRALLERRGREGRRLRQQPATTRCCTRIVTTNCARRCASSRRAPTQRALIAGRHRRRERQRQGASSSRANCSSSESDRRTALASAGNLLMRLREYSSAADLIEASTRGQTTTAASTQRIAMLRKTQRNDGKAIQPTDPRGVVLRSFVELLAIDDDADGLRKLLAPGSEFVVDSAGLRGAHGAASSRA